MGGDISSKVKSFWHYFSRDPTDGFSIEIRLILQFLEREIEVQKGGT